MESNPTLTLYTIGHSNLPIERFVALLRRHGIATLVDVRTSPYSRYNPQFNREALSETLRAEGIAYRFAGESLGGRPSDPTCYKQGRVPEGEADFLHEVDYRQVMQRPWFQKGIRRLLDYAAEAPTAIMCSEAKPQECHRHHLIATYVLETSPDLRVLHLLSGGELLNAAHLHVTVDGNDADQLAFDF